MPIGKMMRGKEWLPRAESSNVKVCYAINATFIKHSSDRAVSGKSAAIDSLNMNFIIFLVACYTLRWSVSLLTHDEELPSETRLTAFWMGVISTPLVAWAGILLLI